MQAATAESTEQALALLRAAVGRGLRYDVAIVDMAELVNGSQLVDAIKADPAIASVALVLFLPHGMRGRGDRSPWPGGAAYLHKPVRQSNLYECLSDIRAARAGGVEASGRPGLVVRLDQPAVAVQRQVQAVSAVRIVIAEDNVINQRVAIKLLQNLGYRAEAVPNGRVLIDRLETTAFDLIFMDCQMPEMDGFAATAEIRRREGDGRRTVIIAMTANALDGDEKRCLAAGMDDYLSKPVSAGALQRKLERWTSQVGVATLPVADSTAAETSSDAVTDEIIDLSRIADLKSGDEAEDAEFIGGLIDVFLENTILQLSKLGEAVSGNQATEIRRLAHGLKGSGANMGARQLPALCLLLEGKADVSRDAHALFVRIEQACELLQRALQAEQMQMHLSH
jgi:two-component system sensor histidine kinase/response regulator